MVPFGSPSQPDFRAPATGNPLHPLQQKGMGGGGVKISTSVCTRRVLQKRGAEFRTTRCKTNVSERRGLAKVAFSNVRAPVFFWDFTSRLQDLDHIQLTSTGPKTWKQTTLFGIPAALIFARGPLENQSSKPFPLNRQLALLLFFFWGG